MNKLFRSGLQKFAQPYTVHPFTPNRQLYIQDQQMEAELRAAPKCKFSNSTHVIAYNFLPRAFQKIVLE